MEDLLARPTAFVDFTEWFKVFLTLLAVSSARFYALALIFPPLGDQAVQGTVRNGVCLTMGVFMAWGQPIELVRHIDAMHLAILILKEGTLGLMLGFAASTVFWVAEAAGGLIDNQAGFNNVQQSNPASGQECTPVGNLMGQLGHACFWMLGGFTILVALLFESYAWWPLMKMAPDWSDILLKFTQAQMSTLVRTLVTLAAPMMFMLVLVDVGFGLIGKTADKLEPNSLSQPVKGAVAMLMLAMLVALFFQETRSMLALHHLRQELLNWIGAAAHPR